MILPLYCGETVCYMIYLSKLIEITSFAGTSHEINKIELLSDDDLKQLMPMDKVEEHRQRALSPLHPRLVY